MSFNLNQLMLNAASIDEVLSCAYQPITGQKDTTDRAALRLAAWSRAAASGDWSLFAKRIERDGLSIESVLSRFAEIRLSPDAQHPLWFTDAHWIYKNLTEATDIQQLSSASQQEPQPFETLFLRLVGLAEAEMVQNIPEHALALFSDEARSDMRHGLLKLLTSLYAPVLYSQFVAYLKAQNSDGKLPPSDENTNLDKFELFVEQTRQNGFSTLFSEKPVLLRLTAVIIRQWITTTQELVLRLAQDIDKIRSQITGSTTNIRVNKIGGDLSDPHNFGHSVQIITFEDESKIVYKPKDLRLDVAWNNLIESFNANQPPIDLKPVKTISSEDYGWTEFIPHTSCETKQDFENFYRRSGAWLAIFHLFASSDMHFENIIACGAYPVPIDLEMILQASTPEYEQATPETEAGVEASRLVINSVLMVGMLPSYAKSPNNKIFDAGGLNAVKSSLPVGAWKNINTNGMRWMQKESDEDQSANLPHIRGEYAQLGNYLTEFIKGFEQYSTFLLEQRDATGIEALLKNFKNLPVRKVIRNTRFYYMLLQRLKDHRSMTDGITWSAQAEFLSRLADWDGKKDLLWPLQKVERLALINLNIPHFVSPSDKDELQDITGCRVSTNALPGLERAKQRFEAWSPAEIQWQVEVIKLSTSFVSRSTSDDTEGEYLFKHRKFKTAVATPLNADALAHEAGLIAATIKQHSIIKDSSAAWIGLDWLGGSEVGQLVTIGPDLYNGTSGIALFLAAYANYSGDAVSRELAYKSIAQTRQQISNSSAGRWSRNLGIGACSGLGSIIYALTSMSELFNDPDLLQDAHRTTALITKELIAADRVLDVIGGSAGAILALLALYRKTGSEEALSKAVLSGEHLLRQPRRGETGKRSWIGLGMGETLLSGFSHGATGFAAALSSLASITNREDFAQAANECLAFEKGQYDDEHKNWPDLRSPDGKPGWPNQWCHGATGIGLGRAANLKFSAEKSADLETDMSNAVLNVSTNWPQHVDTLCCGTLGTIEFLAEAGTLLNRDALGQLSDQRLAEIIAQKEIQGGYAWNAGSTAFNLGFFRGLSGVGYTIMRRLNPKLPNVLIFE